MIREFSFIEMLAARFGIKGPGLVKGIGDDCAHLEPAQSGVQLVTTDMLTHGIHFSERYLSWQDIGWRSVAVNLSDLAASGADPSRPILMFLSIAVPRNLPNESLMSFVEGVEECAHNYGALVAGGDSTSTDGPFCVSITAVGYTDNPVSRDGASDGDLLCVCGEVGKAGAGFQLLDRGKKSDDRFGLCAAFGRPEPLLKAGHALASNKIAAAMLDISDSVISDAKHLAVGGGCDVLIRIEDLPVPQGAIDTMGRDKALKLAATFGDDYALLCAISEENLEKAGKLVKNCGNSLTVIGRFSKGQGRITCQLDGKPFTAFIAGYQHDLGR